jgi:hypothetical protein
MCEWAGDTRQETAYKPMGWFATEHDTPAVVGAMKGWCRRAGDLVAVGREEPVFPVWTLESGADPERGR